MSRTTFTDDALRSLGDKGVEEVARLAAKELNAAEGHLKRSRALLKMAEAKELQSNSAPSV